MDFSTNLIVLNLDSNLKFRFDSLCVDFDIEFWSFIMTDLDLKFVGSKRILIPEVVRWACKTALVTKKEYWTLHGGLLEMAL